MRKILILGLIVLTACSDNLKLEGTYKDKSCGITLTCSYFEFYKDGNYRYNYITQSKYHKKFNGLWELNGDTVYLKPHPYIFPDSSTVEILDSMNSPTTTVSVNMVGGYEKGQEPDTTRVQWYISFDDGKEFTSTDQNGKLIIEKQLIKSIIIQDLLQNMGGGRLFRHKDSIFEINSEADEINIFLALTRRVPDEIKDMPKKLYWEGNKLYPVDFVKNINSLWWNRNYYERTNDAL